MSTTQTGSARSLRPRGIADMLDEAADLYRRNFVLLVGTAGMLYAPYLLFQKYAQSASPDDRYEALGLFAVQVLFAAVVEPLATGALTFAISERYLQRGTSIGECYRRVARPGVFLPLLGAVLLRSLIVAVPAFVGELLAGLAAMSRASGAGAWEAILGLFVIVALIVLVPIWLRLVLVVPALILERPAVRPAFRRSWTLMKGNCARAFALLLVVGLVMIIAVAIVTAPTQVTISDAEKRHLPVTPTVLVIDVILTVLMGVLIAPVVSIIMILLYYDIRIRREGLDLEVLASELDARLQAAAAFGPASLPQENVSQTQPGQDSTPGGGTG